MTSQTSREIRPVRALGPGRGRDVVELRRHDGWFLLLAASRPPHGASARVNFSQRSCHDAVNDRSGVMKMICAKGKADSTPEPPGVPLSPA